MADQTQNDPWASFPDAQQEQQPAKDDPWAQFPDAEGQSKQTSAGSGKEYAPSWLRNTVKEDPDTYYGSVLPFKRNEKTGETSLALPEFLRGSVRGAADLAEMEDNPQKEITPEALGDLAMFSPAPHGVGTSKEAAKAAEGLLPKDEVTNNIIPMSGGQKAQIPDLQRFENAAQAGLKGDTAQEQAVSFRNNQSAAMQREMEQLAPVAEGQNPANVVGKIQKIIRDNYDTSSKGVDTAYDQARAATSENPIQIPNEDISEHFLPQIKEIEQNYMLDHGAIPKASAVIDGLYSKLGLTDEQSKVAVPLEDLETWRRGATNIASNSKEPDVRSAVRQMVSAYDQYMSGLPDRAPPEAADAINSFKEAVATRAEHGKMFEGSDIVGDLINNKTASVDDLTKQLFGSGNIRNQKEMLDDYNSLLRASGPEAAKTRAYLQQGFAQKLFNNSVDGKLSGGENSAVSPAKMLTQFKSMFQDQRQLATSLYGAENVDRAGQVIKDLELITSKQPMTYNSSGTAYASGWLQQKANNVLANVASIPYIGKITWPLRIAMRLVGQGNDAAGDLISGVDAQKTFSGAVPKKYMPKEAASEPTFTGLLPNIARTVGKGVAPTTKLITQPAFFPGMTEDNPQQDQATGLLNKVQQ